MNKLGRGPLEHATYEISKLYDFQFQRTLFLCFNPLPDERILDWSKLKEIAEDILKCIESEK